MTDDNDRSIDTFGSGGGGNGYDASSAANLDADNMAKPDSNNGHNDAKDKGTSPTSLGISDLELQQDGE